MALDMVSEALLGLLSDWLCCRWLETSVTKMERQQEDWGLWAGSSSSTSIRHLAETSRNQEEL